ncbi:MAG: 50S ribosome-binding GTPase [Chloroflexi bacterium]|nr:50S ribosome-binding GTPase [Chloroflexota bacterium]
MTGGLGVRRLVTGRTSVSSPDWLEGTGAAGGLAPCLARLEDAIGGAEALGVRTVEAAATRDEAMRRLGFPSEAYVVALVGGTGVGKSSLLNVLAGAAVSPASVRRPTTSTPVAWVPRALRGELSPLLRWLDVPAGGVREHDAGGLGSVAVLDLPDLDSVEEAHRDRVEAVLPRVDAVVWVTDPEKYRDALLHDRFLRVWVPRLARQLVVVNKSDRLSIRDVDRVIEQLRRDLDTMGARAGSAPDVLAVSAQTGDVAGLRSWLAEHIEAKRVIQARLRATIGETIRQLANEAGIDPASELTPFLAEADRVAAADRATDALLRIIDLPTLERQAVAATRARARARGAGPLGGITSRIYRWSGRQARVADPEAFLARWRERGSLAPATEAVRQVLAQPLRAAAPASRPRLAQTADPARLVSGLGASVERAIAYRGRQPPSSALWPLIGLFQSLATLAIAISALWVVLWVFVRFPVDAVVVPLLGRVPTPFVALVLSLLVGYLIARLLGLHAGLVGRRWARSLAGEIRDNVAREVHGSAFVGLDVLEAARASLWNAARGARADCRTS